MSNTNYMKKKNNNDKRSRDMGRVSYSLKLRIFFFDRVKGTLEFRISNWDTGISINTLRSISSVLPFPYLFL